MRARPEIQCLDCKIPLSPDDMLYHIIRRHKERARAVLAFIRRPRLARG